MDPLLTLKALAPVRTAGAGSALDRYCGGHKPHAKQQRFLSLDAQEALYGGAAGGGKSDAVLMDALQHVDTPGYNAILFRRTFTELALPEAIMARSHEWLAGTDAHWDGLNKQWRFPAGSTVGFGYLDGPNDHFRYQSAAFQFIGWDELTQFLEKPYRYLFSRLRRLAGVQVPVKVRGATNPGGVGHDWVKRRFAIPDDVDFTRVYSSEGRVFVPASRFDNEHLDQESYGQSLAQLDSATLEQLGKGRWVRDASGLVYHDFSDANVIGADRVPVLPGDERWYKVFAADFGVVDAMAFGVLAWAKHEPNVYLLESDEWTGMSPSEAAELAVEWSDRHGGFSHWVGDIGGLGKAFQAEWTKRYSLPLEPADKQNKLGYIKLLNGDMRRGKFLVVDGPNDKLVDCLRTLPWQDETQRREHPGFPNHLTDMTLYGWRNCHAYAARERTAPETRDDRWSNKAKRMQRSRQEQDYYERIGWDG